MVSRPPETLPDRFPHHLSNSRAPRSKKNAGLCLSKKPRRVRRPQAANQVKSCSAGACTWQNILLALQVWNLSAKGRQILGPPRKPSGTVCVGRGDARERAEVSLSGGTGAERTLRRRARGRVQPFRKSGLSHFFEKAAPCRAHNLSASSRQIPHLQGEKCFQPRTRHGRKQISCLLCLRARNSARFFRQAEPRVLLRTRGSAV